MKNVIKIGKITWVDLESPTQEELHDVMHQFDIDPLIMHELLEPSLHSRVEKSGEFLYMAFHFPIIRDGKTLSEMEIDFVLSKNVLISARYRASGVFENKIKSLELKQKQNKNLDFYNSSFDILYELLMDMYKHVEKQIEEVRDALEDIEEEIFNDKEKEMVFAISSAGRDILNIHQALETHPEILKSLKETILAVDNDSQTKLKLKNLENIFYKLKKYTDALSNSLHELRETNNMLLSTKQNEVMKIFTILAFVTFPLSLVASIFGMNTTETPILGKTYHLPIIGEVSDFWVVVALMTIATIFMFLYFRYKKWI